MSYTGSSSADARTTPAGRRWPAALSLVCVVLFAALMHWPIFVQGKTASAFDLSYFTFIAYRNQRPSDLERASNGLFSDPVLLFDVWDKAMYEGRLEPPWVWNPYAGCGSPLLANGQSAPFYPLKLIAYAPFGVHGGIGVLCFLKMLLAGLFMWAYMRALGAGYVGRTLGALAFMACGFLVAWLLWSMSSAAIMLPVVLLGCEWLVGRRTRRGIVLIAAATALGLLAGHPETSFHIAFVSGVYLIARLTFARRRDETETPWRLGTFAKPLGALAAATMLGAAVAGVQVVPTVEGIGQSALRGERIAKAESRSSRPVPWYGNTRRMHRDVLAQLVPNTWGNPSKHSHWWGGPANYNSSAAYAGIGVALLAVFAWRYWRRDARIRVLCVLQALALGFVFGLPLIEQTVGRLPLFEMAANRRFLLVLCFTNAAMAGLVLEHALAERRLSIPSIAWMALIVLVFAALVIDDYRDRFAQNPHDWIRAYGRRQVAHFAGFLVPWLALLFLPRMKLVVRAAAVGALGLVWGTDAYLTHFAYSPFIDPGQIYPTTPAIEFLQAQEAPVRALPLDGELGPNVTTLYGVQDARIYDAIVYAPYETFLERLGCTGPWHVVDEPDMRLCSVAGIRWIYARPEWAAPDWPLELRYEDNLTKIYENTDALPLAYVSRQWQEVGSPGEAYDLLTADDGAWRSTTAVELRGAHAPEPSVLDETAAHTPVKIAEHRPHRVTLDLDGETTGLLVLSDCYYPGWTARVDGERRPIHRANGTFRGIFVDAGDRQVVFTYEPASFRYGLALTVAGLIVLVAVAVAPRLRSRRHSAA